MVVWRSREFKSGFKAVSDDGRRTKKFFKTRKRARAWAGLLNEYDDSGREVPEVEEMIHYGIDKANNLDYTKTGDNERTDPRNIFFASRTKKLIGDMGW